jgi:adenylate kinase
MKLIFLHGLPGVGKLTVARALAELTGYRLFHNHLSVDLVESVFEFGSEPFVELREMIWLAVFARAAEAGLAGLIFTFAYDRTVRRDFIGNARSVLESSGSEILFVELKCTTAELERRIAHPSRARFGKLNSVERFRELSAAGAFVYPGMPADGLVMDTTGVSASEAARMIASKSGLQ